MALDFTQNYGFGHVLLQRDFGSQISFPRTIACEIKVEGGWSGSDKNVIMIRADDGDGGIALQLTDSLADTFLIEAALFDFVFQENAQSPTLSYNQWSRVLIEFQGSGINCTRMTAYADGVAGTPFVPVIIKSCTDVYDRITVGGFRTNSTNTQAITNTCIAKIAHWDVLLSAGERTQYFSGVAPTSIQASHLVDYLPGATAETAGNNSGTSAVEFDINEVPPSGEITTCADSMDVPDPVETGEDDDECGSEDEADPLAEAIEWPKCVLVPGGLSVDLITPSVSPGRSFTSREKIVQPDAGRWRIIYSDVSVRDPATELQRREIESFLKGRSGVVLVPVYEGKLSDEHIAAMAASDYSIGTTNIGIVQTAGTVLTPGMQFSTADGWLYRIQTIIEQETGELYDVMITPPLRADVASDDVLDFNTPVCRSRLAADAAMDINLGLLRYGSVTMEFREDV